MNVAVVRELWRFPVKSMAGERLDRADVGVAGIVGDRGWAVRDTGSGEIYNAKRFPILMQCAARYRGEPAGHAIPPVDIEFPDGAVIGSDSDDAAVRLSALMRRPVSLVTVQPPADRAFYRRRAPGAALVGALGRFTSFRRLVQIILERTPAGAALRVAFGREPGEPLPDLSEMPEELFEFQTPPGTYFDAFPIHLLTTASLASMQRRNPASNWDVRRFRPNILVDTGDAADPLPETQWRRRTLRIGGATLRGELLAPRCAMPTHRQRDLSPDPGVLRTVVREANQCLGLYATVSAGGMMAVGDPLTLA